ncbi:hypothetical protein EV701_110150 [Chthoniobacter flavus]|nr:hypothetical protein EV701_110150 [Chthoniobacter flavus]
MASARGEDVSLRVIPEQESYTVGEPIVLDCSFTNTSDKARNIDLGFNDREVVFILKPGTPGATELPNLVHRGGGDFSFPKAVPPHQTVTRYLILDQWYRPSVPGALHFEMVTNLEGVKVTAPFTLTVIGRDPEIIKKSAEDILVKFEAIKKARSRDPSTLVGYRGAAWLFFSYLDPQICTEMKARHRDDSDVLELITMGERMGPGGCRWLD